jgi:hypothetical protein
VHWPFVRETKTPDGCEIVIRAQPNGVKRRALGGGASEAIRRWLSRDHSWLVVVSFRENDPFGPYGYRELVDRKAEVDAALDRITEGVHTGTIRLVGASSS